MDKKMRIAFMVTSSEVGGAQRWVADHMSLVSNETDLLLITNQEGWLTNQVKDYAKLFLDTDVTRSVSLFYIFRLIFVLRAFRADCVVCSSAYAGFYGRIAAFTLRIRSYYISHGWSCLYKTSVLSRVFRSIEQVLSLITDKVICVSKMDYDNAVDKVGISKRRLVIIKNSIFSDYNKVDKPETDHIGGILMVGRAAPPKRHDLLLIAANKLSCPVTFVGASTDLFRSFDIPSNVRFLGEVPDFDDFSKYDVFTLLSDSEGMPISAIEAMSFGLPLVLSNVGGCPELINKNGYLVNNDPNEIAWVLEQAIHNKDAMGKASKINFERSHNLHEKREQFLALFGGV